MRKNTSKRNSWVKGLEGENTVLNYLNTLPKNYFVFHDVTLPKKKGNIDHVVIGPNGIFVKETKNYSGMYSIKGDKWYYHRKGRAKKKIDKNPGVQVVRNVIDLKSFLNNKGITVSELWVNAIVAFINHNFKIIQKPVKYTVLYPETVPKYILNQNRKQDTELLKKVALS